LPTDVGEQQLRDGAKIALLQYKLAVDVGLGKGSFAVQQESQLEASAAQPDRCGRGGAAEAAAPAVAADQGQRSGPDDPT